MLSDELFSVEQVAERLGLHVRTVRNYVRDGRLKAVRIGKQYRIARADLEGLTGGVLPETPGVTAGRHRYVEVSSVVQVDAIGRDLADRVSTMLTAATASRGPGQQLLRFQTIYDEERASMKIVVIGGLADTAELLRLVGVLTEADQ